MKFNGISLGFIGIACLIVVWIYTQSQNESADSLLVANDGLRLAEHVTDELNFVGAEACRSCHANEYQQWERSDHFKAMQAPSSTTVLGDFSDIRLEFHETESRFYQQDQKYFVDTNDGKGKLKTFEVKHTFGFYPLQQYLVDIGNGHLQALNVAWDSRSAQEGGSRWFHLQADEKIDSDHPFHWSKHFQNWNSRCADCHSTNLQRHYEVSNNNFKTSFSEPNVACEACHGPASKHVEFAHASKLDVDSGFQAKRAEALRWQFLPDKDIAEPVGEKTLDDLNMCGACHSLRTQLAEDQRSGDFHDLNRLQLINPNTYFADGQSKEEAFVVGSFLQSKMFHKGVSCGNCHNPHSGKVIVEGNGLCAQCHKPQVYDSVDHHKHEVGTQGAQCIDCHMPERTFMRVDKRRDHSFTIPRPDLSESLGVPNACVQCHSDKSNEWANEETQAWGVEGGEQHWAHLLDRAFENDVMVTRPAVEAVLDTGSPDLIRGSILASLASFPSRVSADVARRGLYDKSPLVRRGAVAALSGQPADVRWQLLSPYIADPVRSVRMAVAETLADVSSQIPIEDQGKLNILIEEYREGLAFSADSVSTQLNIANLELRLGNREQAELAFEQALKIEPSYVPALLGFADFYRSDGQITKEFSLLKAALGIAPDGGAVQHAIGLYYVRQKNYSTALQHLKLAVEMENASPYYAYVYAVALENQGRIAGAIEALESANTRWPNQYELLMTLVLYLEKSDQSRLVPPYLSQLSLIAPGAPAVKQLIAKYQGQ